MSLRTYNPTSPAIRHLVTVDRKDLYKGDPEKSLVVGISSSGGRNNLGRITSRFRGGGHKKLYRIVDFKRNKYDIFATVLRLEYDPNRTANIALIEYEDSTKSYIIAPENLKPGMKVISTGIESSQDADIKVGNALPLKKIPVGTMVHNVELKPGKGGQMGRSAGAFVQIVGRDAGFVQVKLSSGEVRLVNSDCMATIGVVSNAIHQNIVIGKAGRNRWKGRKSAVRGVAMNPIDHPHGGGEGKTSGGRHPVTPWGKPTKGKKTRKNKRTSKFIVKRRNSK